MKILLVIDVQEKYLNYYDADPLPKINARIAAAKSIGTQVFYVRNIGIHGDDDNYALAKNLLIAITMFVKSVIHEQKLPFEVKASPFYSDENVAALKRSIKPLDSGK